MEFERRSRDGVTRRWGKIRALSLLVVLWAASAPAVTVDVGDGAGAVGDTVIVPVTTGDITGLGVYAYETRVTWPANWASLIDVSASGTLSASWGPPTFNIQTGAVNAAAAGSSALAGSGTLVELRFVLGPNSGSIALTLSSFLFNEGNPPATPSNGSLSITALPTISINPNSGEIVVGDSLLFTSTGGTPPYTYTSSDPAVANFGTTAYLKGISPGSVFATTTDQNGITRTTTNPIFVRAVKLTAGTASGVPGDTVGVPMTISSPGSHAIVSAEFSVTYDETRLTAIGTRDAGTIAQSAGWAASVFNVTAGKITVSMAGASSLSGPGILVYVKFVIDPATFNTTTVLTPAGGLFNEIFPPLHANGSVGITGFPVITVNPNTSTIVAGDNLQFSVSGPTTPPLTWGVTNPAVASISASGNLTALAAGTTRVFAVDNIGSRDTTDVITICHLYVVAPTDTIYTSYPTPVPISPDRSMTGMGIYGFELILTFSSTAVQATGATSTGTASAIWGQPTVNTQIPGQVIVVHAGSTPLSGNLPLVNVNFQGLPSLYGGSTALTITKILFNEGTPCALAKNGTLKMPTGIVGAFPPRISLGQNIPNPFNPSTRIPYSILEGGWVKLQIFSPRGDLIRTLIDRFHEAPGSYVATWDGIDDGGKEVATGVYFYRLKTGGVSLVKKMVLLK